MGMSSTCGIGHAFKWRGHVDFSSCILEWLGLHVVGVKYFIS